MGVGDWRFAPAVRDWRLGRFMKRGLHVILLLGLILPLLISCAGATEDEPVARTYYESLVLDTPETAVETFVDAFQRDDFETLYLIFAPNTQMRITNSLSLLQYQDFVKVNDYEGAYEIASDSVQFKMLDEWEHMTTGYRFDSMMLVAKQHSAFLIDLSGDVSILRTEEFGDGERSFSDVITTVSGIEGEVVFRMKQAPSGRWRVRQVIVPDGNEEQIPWSVPTDEE